MQVGGRPLTLGSPRDSRLLGLRFVHQDLGLVDELTASENMALSWGYPRRAGVVRARDHDQRVQSALARLGATLDPDLPVGELRAVQRAAVAIARAISDVEHDIAALVLDEPTASLPAAEVETLFRIIKEIRARGVSVLYVSHRLDEVMEIADDVSVLRDGRLVSSGPLGEQDKQDLVRLILGSQEPEGEVPQADRQSLPGRASTGFSIQVSSDRLRDVQIAIGGGEIVGVAGLDGSGREDLCAAIVGAVPSKSCLTDLDRGVELTKVNPAAARKLGVALVLSNRAPGAAVHEFSVRENVSLPSLGELTRWLTVRRKLERARAVSWVRRLAIQPRDVETTYTLLSGGNQQKTVMAKWLAVSPRLLLLDDPTTGVDVGARNRIYSLVAEQAAGGLPVLVASSDIEDLTAICDRVVVLRRGRITDEVTGNGITEERLLHSLNGGLASESRD